AGKTFRGIGQLVQPGYANLVPACVTNEAEANDTAMTANMVTSSGAAQSNVCGTYGARGDLDYFKIDAMAGQVLSLRVLAADLGSTLDSVLEVTAPDNRTFTNDNASASTKDSALLLGIDMTGTWRVRITHSQGNRVGGPGYFYNLLVR